ncbi:hypothetical protein [Hoeflea ulvae]|uniref:Uncharacterized protein n=1 Tax=Hoeflea ulvae TaxID=2983764 RepID=A0ABT3YFH6_9HYPH|nr:hypothetical protein [Hoeflea ulvae]MCY0094611.1 hypothetical protein [Hoeflea ulvae]
MIAPLLSERQVADLMSPLGLVVTPALVDLLTHQIEAATRSFEGLLQEPDQNKYVRFQADYLGELKRIADDPARALSRSPETDGALHARHLLDLRAVGAVVDLETRVGAAAAGDIAMHLLTERPNTRVDSYLRIAEEELFDMLCQTLRLLSPQTLDNLPSNETIDNAPHAVISFALAFIQIVVDRALERVPGASARTRKRFAAILDKSDRRLLDGIRKERQFWLSNGGWPEGEIRATILE